MTITREQLEKAAKAAGIKVTQIKWKDVFNHKHSLLAIADGPYWEPHSNHGQLHDLAMACDICIDPLEDQIRFCSESPCEVKVVSANCQDFPALAEAVILAACEQFDARSDGNG